MEYTGGIAEILSAYKNNKDLHSRVKEKLSDLVLPISDWILLKEVKTEIRNLERLPKQNLVSMGKK